MSYLDFKIRLVDVSVNQDNSGTSMVPNLDKIIEAGFLGVGVRVGYGIVKDGMFDYFWQSGKGRIARLPYFFGDYYSHILMKLLPEAWGDLQGEKWYDRTQRHHRTDHPRQGWTGATRPRAHFE